MTIVRKNVQFVCNTRGLVVPGRFWVKCQAEAHECSKLAGMAKSALKANGNHAASRRSRTTAHHKHIKPDPDRLRKPRQKNPKSNSEKHKKRGAPMKTRPGTMMGVWHHYGLPSLSKKQNLLLLERAILGVRVCNTLIDVPFKSVSVINQVLEFLDGICLRHFTRRKLDKTFANFRNSRVPPGTVIWVGDVV